MTSESQRQKVLEEKRHVSSKISDLSRYIGFGLVAVAYAILTSDSATVEKLYGNYSTAILISAGLGALTIVLDYFQFLAGYLSVQTALKNEAGGYNYKPSKLAYKIRSASFWAKQVSAAMGALLFCVIVVLPLICA